jgi:glycosyltransferase involved in cell wall biosynthesis
MAEHSAFGSLSVVIPTYNRGEILAKALEGYLLQSSPHLIRELLVVDDGSTDATESMVRELAARSKFPICYLRQANKGPAAARNMGIRQVRSGLVLFTDSDIIPGHNFVEQHLQWHSRNTANSSALLGYVTWAPELKPTTFMRWYGERKLFSFHHLHDNREVDFRFFYTCNVSLKTEFLRTCGQFDEDFKTAAFEDIEFGYRMHKQGLKLFFDAAAIGYHYQFFTFEDACRKCWNNIPAGRQFLRKEAGQQFQLEDEKRKQTLRYRFSRPIAAVLARLIRPFRRFLDSSIPLPGIVCSLSFWDSTRPDAPAGRSNGSVKRESIGQSD